jgi:presqualene diphosphate synthase
LKEIAMTVIAHEHSAAPASRGPAGDRDIVGEEEQAIARSVRAAGRSFFWAMRLLPAPRRNAMYALYAFCREVHDVADGEVSHALKCALLSDWRCEIARLFAGRAQHMVTRALAVPVRIYGLRCEDFLAVIDGVEMDARHDIRAPSRAELDLYCARVAASVGRIAIRILGLGTPDADRVAAELGHALQLTNILRDLVEDAGRHRLYLPRESLRTHGIFTTIPSTVLAHPALPQVCRDLAAGVEERYAAAAEALKNCPLHKMRAAALMLHFQRAILRALVARGWRRLDEPVRIPAWRKAAFVVRLGLMGG